MTSAHTPQHSPASPKSSRHSYLSYSCIANAPDREIDERELAQRYRAYFYAYQYIIGGLILGSIGAELVAKMLGAPPSRGVVNNFIWTMVFTSFVMPAAFLAWWDREEY